ncbi:hypothetical protein [Botrimarina sp.]|uniref:DUF7192 family protein n=1 Tax=Botrimarina sp. TaxID=2795802 RepID=UPI0032EC273D
MQYHETTFPADTKPTEVKTFPSVAELVEHGQPTPRVKPMVSSFVGRKFNSRADARQAANAPWPQGVKTIDRIASEIADEELPEIPVVRRRPAWSEDDGDEVCIDRMRVGRPYWRTTRRTVTHRVHELAIVVDVTSPACRKAEDIFYRGAAATVLARTLQDAGHRVEVWAAAQSRDTYTDYASSMIGVCLKRYEESLDIATLANATSGWFYRTAVLEAHCRSMEGRSVRMGIGYAAPLSDAVVAAATGLTEYTLIGNAWTYDEAVTKVRQTLRRLARPDRRCA